MESSWGDAGVTPGLDPGVQLAVDSPDAGLKEIILRWFTETQVPLILNNGNFPDWFRGFTARKDAEDLLRDKGLGCFLIRLSDKAIGYILSYRGHDRCRHFVITQDQDGGFVVSGDHQTYGSLAELIQHYRVHPIQPFGEHLTCTCHQVNTAEVYDTVTFSPSGRSGVSVQALRSLWDQKPGGDSSSVGSHRTEWKNDLPPCLPPSLPPKNRKLTGAVSVDTVSLSQGVPPVPKRGLPLSGSLSNTASHPGETQSPLSRRRNQDSFRTSQTRYPGDVSPPVSTHPELKQVESRSRSLPDPLEEEEEEEEEEEYSNQNSVCASSSSLSALKKVTCQTYSLHKPSEQQSEEQEEVLRRNPLYQDSERAAGGPSQRGDDNMYELIPQEAAAQGNTYETLEDLKSKKSKPSWGKSNLNWKKFLPEYKKK